MSGLRRRDLLSGAALALVGGAAARAGIVKGELPWRPDAASPPPRVAPGPWQFFTPDAGPVPESAARAARDSGQSSNSSAR
jgi:hypothetical protein